MKLNFLIGVGLLMILSSCSNNDKPIIEEKTDKVLISNIFEDTIICQIHDAIDRRDLAKLQEYSKLKDDKYINYLVRGFSSVQDTTGALLLPFLQHKNPEIRINAAWSIAQQENNGQFDTLLLYYELEKNNDVRNALLEAMGRSVLTKAEAKKYGNLKIDPEVHLGYAAGLYAIAYSKSELNTKNHCHRAFELLAENTDNEAGVYLSQYLSRCSNEFLSSHLNDVKDLMARENNVDIKLGLIKTLGKILTEESKEYIYFLLSQEQGDIRILVDALRALSHFEEIRWRSFGSYVFDKNENVSLAAITCIPNSNFNPHFNEETINDASMPNHRSRAALVKACALKNPSPEWSEYLISSEKKLKNPTDRAHYIRALAISKENIDHLLIYMPIEDQIPAKTAYLEALLEFDQKGELSADEFQKAFDLVFESADEGAIAMLCNHMRNPDKPEFLGFKDNENFKMALDKLVLPTDMETQLEILQTIAFLNGEEYIVPDPAYNNPIDWELVRGIAKDQRVKIETTSGDYIIELDVENAPGSVSNFVELINSDFFNNKTFHRVVPNFVIQTGCTRGDGYGSVDFTIRSEFNLHRYTTGAVGMASAGPDTESCQWFVTHLPTPFLEGRYTIFAYVVDGMDVVNKIKVGDEIVKIVFVDNELEDSDLDELL